MKRIGILIAVAFMVLPAWAAQPSSNAHDRFRAAYVLETTDREIEKAANIYAEIANDIGVSSDLRSESYYRLGLCHERLGKSREALEAYRGAVDFGLSSNRPYIESAKSGVARLEVALRPVPTLEVKPTLKRGEKFFTPIHQFLLAGLSFNRTVEDGDGWGLELFGYEYIRPSGFALKFSPLSFHAWSDEYNQYGYDWAPLWLRYYLLPETDKTVPFIGIGYVRSVRQYDDSEFVSDEFGGYYRYVSKETSRNGVGLELGVALGDLGRRSSRFTFKVLPIGTQWRDTTLSLGYDFSFGFRSK